MPIAFPLLGILTAYLIGSLPTAYLMGRVKGIDIRRAGSGNVGATNALRVLGKPWGFGCLLVDLLKGYLPAAFLLPAAWFAPAWPDRLWPWVVGLAAVAGHTCSPWLGFKGGKGVATSLGMLLAVIPLAMLILLPIALGIIAATGYVSLAAIVSCVLLPLILIAIDFRNPPWISVAVTSLLGLFIIWKHRSNIARLRAGTESRIFHRSSPHTSESGHAP
ncbi:MAG: Glycerol-3-phosphate acyltransferase [candidate division BRC1 bacterium ADurb.BinA292]|nr:MAG: Glycerol-3-phosphate acyltransferase [candidate division BRC1 bacterium ADurb.BinA292]